MIDWMSAADVSALIWFIVVWICYTVYADHSRFHARSITAAMNRRRHLWMRETLRRDLRMIDTNILGNLLTSVGFFASTTIFVIGGLVAMLGVAEQGAMALTRLPLTPDVPPAALEIKIVVLLTIFVYAFFKFAWSFRLANYCSIAVGGLPHSREAETPAGIAAAETAATLSALSGHHFNRGLRAYFFALAALGWFISPTLFAIMTAGVVVVLYRREFRSRALKALQQA